MESSSFNPLLVSEDFGGGSRVNGGPPRPPSIVVRLVANGEIVTLVLKCLFVSEFSRVSINPVLDVVHGYAKFESLALLPWERDSFLYFLSSPESQDMRRSVRKENVALKKLIAPILVFFEPESPVRTWLVIDGEVKFENLRRHLFRDRRIGRHQSFTIREFSHFSFELGELALRLCQHFDNFVQSFYFCNFLKELFGALEDFLCLFCDCVIEGSILHDLGCTVQIRSQICRIIFFGSANLVWYLKCLRHDFVSFCNLIFKNFQCFPGSPKRPCCFQPLWLAIVFAELIHLGADFHQGGIERFTFITPDIARAAAELANLPHQKFSPEWQHMDVIRFEAL
mmetsp:Transcript_15752/g.28015  ORF Transcript_15752/g.28015 Transcript_15752/m.28015 type:complete len:340 (+) Transcript_15752:175-1194(+)